MAAFLVLLDSGLPMPPTALLSDSFLSGLHLSSPIREQDKPKPLQDGRAKQSICMRSIELGAVPPTPRAPPGFEALPRPSHEQHHELAMSGMGAI